MADLSDVLTAIANTCANALYPAGSGAASVANGSGVRIYTGWPSDNELNRDLKATPPVSHVTVFPLAGLVQNTTRYRPEWTFTPALTTLTATPSGNTVTFGGAAGAGQVAGVQVGAIGYAYRLLAADAPATVAAAFAAEIPYASAAGATLTAPFPIVSAMVVADTLATAEVARQKIGVQISIWAPDPATRQAIASVIKPALDGLADALGDITDRLALPDGSIGVLRHQNMYEFDTGQTANAYRRTLIYTVEYPTIATKLFPLMLFGQVNVLTTGGAVTTFGTLDPLTNILVDENGDLIVSASGALLTTSDPVPPGTPAGLPVLSLTNS